MLRLIALVLLACCCVTGAAQAQRVDGAEVVDYGIFETSKTTEIADPTISTGKRVDYDKAHIAKHTNVVDLNFPANGKVVFGAKFKLRGSPSGARANVKIVWLYPPPGIVYQPRPPKLRDEYEKEIILGSTQDLFWTLAGDEVRVPGVWRLQIWQGNRMLVEKSFDLVK